MAKWKSLHRLRYSLSTFLASSCRLCFCFLSILCLPVAPFFFCSLMLRSCRIHLELKKWYTSSFYVSPVLFYNWATFVWFQDKVELWFQVALALGLPANRVVCRVKRLGGGFGGKETRWDRFIESCVWMPTPHRLGRSSFLVVPVAVAAARLGCPVRCMVEKHFIPYLRHITAWSRRGHGCLRWSASVFGSLQSEIRFCAVSIYDPIFQTGWVRQWWTSASFGPPIILQCRQLVGSVGSPISTIIPFKRLS